jgi:hypothetical protein
MPSQQRLRPYKECVPAAPRQHPAQRREQQSVVRLETRLADLAAQNRKFVAKHENLQFLRPILPTEEHDQLQQPTHDDVKGRPKQKATSGRRETPTLQRHHQPRSPKRADFCTPRGLPATIKLPTTDIAGKPIDSGARAHAFASYMRIHALEATGGLPYSQLPRFATADGKGTSDPTKALTGKNGQPVDNPVRQVWITETALATALNASYLAENVALFGIVVGLALLLTGIGFGVLLIGGVLRSREPGHQFFGKRTPKDAGARAVPAA